MAKAKRVTEGERITGRALERAFGVGWRTSAEWIADGCPVAEGWPAVTRWTTERRRAEAERRAADEPDFLASLHPADPRHRERLAASVIREIEIAVDKGERLRVEDVGVRMAEELAVFKSALMAIPARVAPELEHASPEEAERIVTAEIDSAPKGLIADDPATWPGAVLMPPSPLDDGLTLESKTDSDADFMPQLHRDDPRYRHHQAQAELRVRELEKFWADTVPLRHVCTGIREQYETIREHFGSLSTRITFVLESEDPADVILRKVQIEMVGVLQELES